MDWSLPLIVILIILGFVTWMFWEMAGNNTLPPCFIKITGDIRTDWIFAFVLLNIYTAFYYYYRIYKPGKYKP